MILFNLRSNVGDMGKTTVEDIHFVLRYEAKRAKSGYMVINEEEEEDVDTRPPDERLEPRNPCNWLWAYLVLTYKGYMECKDYSKIKMWHQQGINDVLDKKITDKQVLDIYKRLHYQYCTSLSSLSSLDGTYMLCMPRLPESLIFSHHQQHQSINTIRNT